jgi:hypothetical protein
MHSLKCSICGTPFTAKRKNAHLCSSKCQQRRHRLSLTDSADSVNNIVPNKPLSLKPIGVENANAFVKEHHRHNKAVSFGPRFAIAVVDQSGTIWGVAIVSHPVTRALNHNGYTGEVRRVCTRPGAPKNCCSMLYSSCWKVWKGMGGTQMISYTLIGEPGTSLRASNWKRVAKSKGHPVGTSWDTHPRKAKVAGTVVTQPKWRWENFLERLHKTYWLNTSRSSHGETRTPQPERLGSSSETKLSNCVRRKVSTGFMI